MATGRLPFAGASASETLDRILHAQPEAMARFNYDVPAELERIVRKCLEKERERRYQSARELLVDLKNLQRDSDEKVVLAAASRRTEAVVTRSRPWRWPIVGATAAVLIIALFWFLFGRRAPVVQPDQINSLAMLPLENLSGDQSPDYFADGMTETLIAGLSKVGALRVSSRTSVMQYKGTRKPLADIARELKVDAVIEGSVQRVGERVKITARLIHALTEQSLWADTYERDLHDVFALQNEIARAVIQEIQIKLTPQEQTRLASARPVNPQRTMNICADGFLPTAKTNRTTRRPSRRWSTPSLWIQPSLRPMRNWRRHTCGGSFYSHRREAVGRKAFVAVEKALSLDPELAVAYLARGRLLWTPPIIFRTSRQFRNIVAP